MKKVVIIIVALLTLGGGGFAAWKFLLQGDEGKHNEKEEVIKIADLSAQELIALTYKMDEKMEISTNLADGGRVVLRFDVVLENENAKIEFEERNSQMLSTTTGTLMAQTSDKLVGSEGKSYLETALKNKFNMFMHEGKVLEVWITKISVM